VAPDPHASAPAHPAAAALTSCPQCNGAVRAGAPWCTQCWADLRPPPPAAAPAEPVALVPGQPLALGQDLTGASAVSPAPRSGTGVGDGVDAEEAGVGWPCGLCEATNPLSLDACAACGSPFLATLSAQEPPLLALPGIGDVTRLGRGARIGLALGVVAVFVLAVFLLGVLLG
jgi:hypothetical protein